MVNKKRTEQFRFKKMKNTITQKLVELGTKKEELD